MFRVHQRHPTWRLLLPQTLQTASTDRQHPSAVLPFVGLPGASVAWIRSVACTGMPPRASVLTRDKLARKQGGPQDAPLYRVSGPRLRLRLLSMRIAPALLVGFPPGPFRFDNRAALVNLVNKIFSSFPCERPRPRRASYLKLSRASPSSPSPFFFSFIDFLIYSSTCFIKLSLPSGHKLSRACCCGINLNPIPCRHHSSLLLLPSCVESAHLESCFLFPQAST